MLNHLVTNGLSHPFHLDESTLNFRGSRIDFFTSYFDEIPVSPAVSKQIAPDETPRFAASDLGLFCLPICHKKDARLVRVYMDFAV